MGCPSECEIGDNLVFSVCTHDPDTGVLTDADSVPTYRVYEDETATPILTGSMAKLDDANTTGFYTESIACTSGNGFENGKSYTIYIAATVDSDQGGICYGFKAYDARKSDVTKILTAAQSATDLKDFADTGYDPSAHKIAGVVLTDTCTTNTDMRGTDSAATSTAMTTAQNDLDTITGADGVTLATLQSNMTTNGRTLVQQLKDVNVYVKANVDSDIEAGTQAFKDSDGATHFTYTIDSNADRTVS